MSGEVGSESKWNEGGYDMNRGHDMSASQSALSLSLSLTDFYTLTVDVRLPLPRENLAGFDGKAAVKRNSNSLK